MPSQYAERAGDEFLAYVQLQKKGNPVTIATAWSIVHRDLSSRRDPKADLCYWCNRCNYWGDTEINGITREVTVGSLLWAVSGAWKS